MGDRKILSGPATPVHLTNADDIVINTGDITLGDVGITGVPDGVDVTQGAIADAAVTTDASGTVSAKLRGLVVLMVNFLSRLPAALTASGNLKVSIEEGAAGGGAVTVADGADVAEGTTTDAAASSSAAEDATSRTGISLWKGIKNILLLLNAKFGSLGQKNMAGSAPVVIASDQSDLPITLDGETVALAAGTNLIGRASASLETSTIYNATTALTPKFVAVNVASSGDNTLIAAVADKKIRVLSVTLIAGDEVTVRFESGAGGTIGNQMSIKNDTSQSGAYFVRLTNICPD
jgi:hypothetical protein